MTYVTSTSQVIVIDVAMSQVISQGTVVYTHNITYTIHTVITSIQPHNLKYRRINHTGFTYTPIVS